MLKPGKQLTVEQVWEHLSTTFAKWQLPDQVLFVDKIPRTSVGKLNKKVVRAEYGERYTKASGA